MTAPAAAKPTLMALAWPIFIEQGLRLLIGTVDTFMVSHVSDGAVAALGVANQVVVLFLIVFNFIAIGTSVVITHHLGARDRAGADQIAGNAIAVNTWMGLAVSLIVYFFAARLLRIMLLPADLMDYALPFLTLMGGTLFMESMNMSIAAVLRAHHHTRDAMLVSVGQNILNVTGNCITLFGLFGCPKLGVTGVAISSVCSRAAACVALWILLDYRTHLRLRARDFVSIVWSKVGRILRIGLPAAGENMNYWLALMTVTTFTARLGGDSLAIQSYSLQIERVVLLFSLSLGLGTEILIGHLVGAGQFEEAYHTLLKSVRTGLILVSCAILPIALFAPYALGCFTNDLVIIAGGTLLLRLGILLEPGRVFNVIVINSLRATGDVWFPISMCAFSTWCVWVPLAWLLAITLKLGMPGIWISMIVDEWLRGLMMHRRWRQRHWMQSARRSHAIVAGGAGDTALV